MRDQEWSASWSILDGHVDNVLVKQGTKENGGNLLRVLMILDQKLALLHSGGMRALGVKTNKVTVEIRFDLLQVSGLEVLLVILEF